MRAEIVNHKGRVLGMRKITPGQDHVEINHDTEGYGTQWQVRTFWGKLLASGPCRTIQGDTVHLNIEGLRIP